MIYFLLIWLFIGIRYSNTYPPNTIKYVEFLRSSAGSGRYTRRFVIILYTYLPCSQQNLSSVLLEVPNHTKCHLGDPESSRPRQKQAVTHAGDYFITVILIRHASYQANESIESGA